MWSEPQNIIAVISAIIALFSAMATLASVILARNQSEEASKAKAKASEIQLRLDENQRKLDENQKRLDYTQLILNEGQKPIPLNDDPKWALFFTEIETGSGLLDAANEARKLPNKTLDTNP